MLLLFRQYQLTICQSPLSSHLHEHGIPFAGKVALHPGGVIAISVVGGLAAAAGIIALCSLFVRFIKSLIKRKTLFQLIHHIHHHSVRI